MLANIDSFTILRRIAQTASCEIFQARDPRRAEDVALKVILPQYARDKRTLRRFQREFEVGQQLQHRNLIKMHEFVTRSARPYLVMNFAAGQTLKRAIYRDHTMVIERGFHWIVRAAQALGYMHQQGWVHLDVKPENLLVEENGGATLIDLALARSTSQTGLLSSIRAKFSGEGGAGGTRSYMSPEQIDNRDIGPASDIYSLGIVIFETFAKRLPLTASDPDAILRMHRTVKPPMLHHVVSQINPHLSMLVARMLEKKPQARPQSMEQVVDTLAKIARPLTEAIGGRMV